MTVAIYSSATSINANSIQSAATYFIYPQPTHYSFTSNISTHPTTFYSTPASIQLDSPLTTVYSHVTSSTHSNLSTISTLSSWPDAIRSF